MQFYVARFFKWNAEQNDWSPIGRVRFARYPHAKVSLAAQAFLHAPNPECRGASRVLLERD
jgi:hypothetical protein